MVDFRTEGELYSELLRRSKTTTQAEMARQVQCSREHICYTLKTGRITKVVAKWLGFVRVEGLFKRDVKG